MKQLLSVRKYKAGYEVRTELIDGADYGCPDFEMKSAYTSDGLYIGDPKTARFICAKRGIRPQLADGKHSVCSIGFNEKEQKWYGWSHRAVCGFGIGDVVKEGDCAAGSGWTEDYLAEHPEADKSLPVGFKAKTLDDAKRIALAFAESVG